MQEENVIISAKDLSVGFLVAKHGMGSLKDFLLSFGISSLFENREVIRNCNLEIKRGECFAIMGKNGCGKSTLLRAISGVMKPSSGALVVNGSVAPMMALGVGLEPELTGLENIRLLGTLMGNSPREIKQLTESIIDFSELSDYDIQSQVKRYSQGMLARLAFSITVAKTPEILIVDEALTVGDMGFKRKCNERIHEIKEAGGTIIFVSHHLDDIRSICTTGCFMKNGQVVKVGDVEEVIALYQEEMNQKKIK